MSPKRMNTDGADAGHIPAGTGSAVANSTGAPGCYSFVMTADANKVAVREPATDASPPATPSGVFGSVTVYR
jgi:hypothetical protein